MPSTYTTNLGIQKPANGEQAGTWGQTVNINSDILDRAVNGSLTLSLSLTSSTLTTSQGVASDGQYKVLTLTGSPSGTHTITIDPATAQTLYLVNNTTAQSVVFTQGSGGNVTIVAGASAIIYSDGAGAGAKVTNLTNALAMGAVKITGGTITGITDLAVADGGTGASTLTGYVKGAGTAALTASATIPSTDITGLGTMATQAASAVAITGGTITGITDLAVADGGTGSSTAAGALVNLGLTATAAELNVLDGVTATTTELNYTAGVTSAIQTQLNAKASLASPALTGTPTGPTASVGTSTTQLATTAFVQNNAGMTLIGVLTTTSGSTQTAGALVLTSYKQLIFEFSNVSTGAGTVTNWTLGSGVILTGGSASDLVNGMVIVSLTTSIACPILSRSASLPANVTGSQQMSVSGFSIGTTSVSLSVSGGPVFDGGAVYIYGMK